VDRNPGLGDCGFVFLLYKLAKLFLSISFLLQLSRVNIQVKWSCVL
jgi:hypothetical protein